MSSSTWEKSPDHYPYVSVLERPSIPANAVFPKKVPFALGGLVIGLVLAVLRVVYRELKGGTFTNPVGAAQIFDAPFLGSLPTWIPPNAPKSLPAPEDPHWAFSCNSAIRSLTY